LRRGITLPRNGRDFIGGGGGQTIKGEEKGVGGRKMGHELEGRFRDLPQQLRREPNQWRGGAGGK